MNALTTDLEGKIERAERSRRWCLTLVSAVVHQSSQRLTVLQGMAGLALKAQMQEVNHRAAFQTIADELERLSKSLGSLREMVEIEKFSESLETVPLVALTKKAVELVSPLGQSMGLKVQLDAERDVHVCAHSFLLERAIHRLILRAIQRSSAGDVVGIEISSSRGSGLLTLRDRGRLVPQRQLVALLDADCPTRVALSDSDGYGLDWALARRTVESSGGRLDLQNQPNRGCTITLTLPLSDARSH